MQSFVNWLYVTPVSTALREIAWIIPLVQTLHIWALSVFAFVILLSAFAAWGVVGRGVNALTLARYFSPWLALSGLTLLATGLVMITAEPDRVLVNWLFWTKMALVAVLVASRGFFHFLEVRAGGGRSSEARANSASLALATAALLITLGVIICGRWIAYVI